MNYRNLQIAARLLIAGGLLLPSTYQQPVAAASHPEPKRMEAVDTYVTEQMNNLEIPGVAIGIVRDDEIVYVRGYGEADNTGRALTPQTPFLIASLSKSITALGIMQLVEEGKLDLDSPVQKYLPWFQVANEDASSQITIRHLLNQTSGFSERAGYIRNLNTNSADDTLEASVRRLKAEALNFPPGTAFEYSNTNYDILGLVIQTVSGQSYESYIQERIFTPLGMTHSHTSLAEARAGNMSSGYYSLFGFPVTYDLFMPYSRTVKPSAGLFSSAVDLSRYLIAHLNQGRYQGNSIVSPTGMAELHALAVKYSDNAGYAMGWAVFPFTEAAAAASDNRIPTGLAHRGDWIGFNSIMVLIPELETGIVVLMNKSDPVRGPALFNIGWSVAMLALGLKPLSAPSENFINRNEQGLLAGIMLLLGTGFVWSVRRLRLLSSQQGLDARQRRKLTSQMILLALVDLALALGLLLIKLPQEKNTLALALRFEPDIGLLYILVLAMTLGLGMLRTILFLINISRAGKPVRS